MPDSRFLVRVVAAALWLLVNAAAGVAETVTLAWDANTEPDVRGYVLRYGTQSGVYTTEIDVGNKVTHAIDLTAPGTYYFVVQAYNDYLRSANSVEVSTTVTIPVSRPALSIDRPLAGMILGGDFVISGWAADLGAPTGTGVDTIHVYAFPRTGAAPVFLGVGSYGGVRGDVGAAYGTRFTNVGYSLTVVGLAPGFYDIAVYARSTVTGTFNGSAMKPVDVRAGLVAAGATVVIDAPGQNSTVSGSITIRGWATDLASTTGGTGIDEIHLWAYPNPGSGRAPVFVGKATYGIPRGDIAAAFGSQHLNSGFSGTVSGLPDGKYDIALLAMNRRTGELGGGRALRVTFSTPVLVMIDAPTANATLPSAPFVVRGWAIDRRSTTDTGINAIHVYAYRNPGSGEPPVFLGFGVARQRPDVAAAFGAQFAWSGYEVAVNPLPAGTYDIVVYVRSTITGAFDNARAVRVVLQ